jgi:hypothetical protein
LAVASKSSDEEEEDAGGEEEEEVEVQWQGNLEQVTTPSRHWQLTQGLS